MANPLTLVIQSFGRRNEYFRAILAIWSYFVCSSRTSVTTVKLFTDNPDFFAPYLEGLPVSYHLLTDEKIKKLRGEIDFLHRMKIGIIEEAWINSESDIIYADSDSFFISDPAVYTDQLNEKLAFMHVLEYAFEDFISGKIPVYTEVVQFLKIIEKESFTLVSGEQVFFGIKAESWNAGIMLFHNSQKKYLPEVYCLTDQFYRQSGSHASEQYAFSLILNRFAKLQNCSEISHHYWYRVHKRITDGHLEKKFTDAWKSLPAESKKTSVKEIIALLPHLFRNHVLTLRDNAIQAFHKDDYLTGYQNAWKAVSEEPFEFSFIRDVLYHSRRKIFGK